MSPRRWPLMVALLLAACGAVALAVRLTPFAQPKPQPLDGKLTVLVRPPDRNIEPVSVTDAGAVPVQAGGAMCLDAQLNQPAFIYLVWLDSEGQVLPLYPWNNERLEVKDINQPPPLRRAGKLVFSPLLGGNWTFGDQAGAETVLLLARRTPLAQGTQIGKLLGTTPAPSALEGPRDVVVLRLTGSEISGSVSKSADISRKSGALAAFLQPLSDHFELIHAVQFSHAAGKQAQSASTPTVSPRAGPDCHRLSLLALRARFVILWPAVVGPHGGVRHAPVGRSGSHSSSTEPSASAHSLDDSP